MNEIKYCAICGSELSERLSDGRSRKYCDNCKKPIYENPIPATAAVCFDESGRLLLVKRGVEPNIGEWCLPGGFLEIDETPEEGSLRELKEETGLVGEVVDFVRNERSPSPFYSSVIVMGYEIRIIGGNIRAGDDSTEVNFFELSELPKIAFQSHINILDFVVKNGRYDIKKSILKKVGAYVITSGDHILVAKESCQAGAKIIQYRDKRSSIKDKLRIAKEIRKISKKTNTLLIVNDNIDLAMLSEADGVHLGQDDLTVKEAKRIVPKNFIIGKSTHSLDQAIEAELAGADYIGVGPIFKTPTKKDYIPVGMDLAKEVFSKVKIPVVAIGGLNGENIKTLLDFGLKNFAMVREFQQDTAENVKKINSKVLVS
jgi:thiamine-phosphate pyrophosphorylase